MKDDTESRKNYLKSHKRSLSSFQTRKGGGGGGGGGGEGGLWACGLCPKSRAQRAGASPSEVYPPGKLQ